MEIKIYYDDTDAGGVIYHANYLKYFERGRTEYMKQRGIDPAAMAQSGIIFVIVRVEVSYLSPARYGDTITVETFIDEISHASVTFGYKIYLSGNNKLLVTGKTKIVMVSKDMKVQRFSDDFIERLKAV
ncbi:MAG: thioesterase family protein [Planctomycetota bacterium]